MVKHIELAELKKNNFFIRSAHHMLVPFDRPLCRFHETLLTDTPSSAQLTISRLIPIFATQAGDEVSVHTKARDIPI